MEAERSRSPWDPYEIIAAARAQEGLSQKAFGREVGKTQSEISRYETGEVTPPADVLMYCLHILGKIKHDDTALSAAQLADLIADRLKGARHRTTRKLLAELVERLSD